MNGYRCYRQCCSVALALSVAFIPTVPSLHPRTCLVNFFLFHRDLIHARTMTQSAKPDVDLLLKLAYIRDAPASSKSSSITSQKLTLPETVYSIHCFIFLPSPPSLPAKSYSITQICIYNIYIYICWCRVIIMDKKTKKDQEEEGIELDRATKAKWFDGSWKMIF